MGGSRACVYGIFADATCVGSRTLEACVREEWLREADGHISRDVVRWTLTPAGRVALAEYESSRR